MAHCLVHLAAVAKAHFDLGRVHVHVYPRRVDVDVQRIHRLALAVQHVFVGAAGGVGHHLVAHEAAVDVAILLVGARARSVWQAGAAGEGDAAFLVGQCHRLLKELFAQHVRQAPLQRSLPSPHVDARTE